MPEIPNVVPAAEVESDWGNDIRDRTLQRYASSAARASAHSSPTPGDLSFLADTGLVYVYYDGAWTPIGQTEEVDNSGELASVNLTTTPTDVLTVSLAIPAYWNSWKCVAFASGRASNGSAATCTIRIRIDGTDQQLQDFNLPVNGYESFSVGGRRTGMTTTGSRSVSLRAHETTADVALVASFLYARAIRTS